MLMKNLWPTPGPRFIQYIFTLTLTTTFLATLFLLFMPASSAAEGLFKPTGTAEDNITLWVPEGAVSLPILATADYLAPADLPTGITYPPNAVGLAFTFGLWQGEGMAINKFNPSIIINVGYQDSDILPALLPEEKNLHLFMYNPATRSWFKLCGSVDIHENVLSAAIAGVTPFEENGSSLLALAIADPLTLNEEVDGQGMTTVSLKGSDLRLQILPDTLPADAYLAITLLPKGSGSSQVKFLTEPADIKACLVDYGKPSQNNRQITQFPKPLKVGFVYDADTLSRVGGKENLTMVHLRNNQWVNVETVGARVTRGDDALSVDTTTLGAFGLAVR